MSLILESFISAIVPTIIMYIASLPHKDFIVDSDAGKQMYIGAFVCFFAILFFLNLVGYATRMAFFPSGRRNL